MVPPPSEPPEPRSAIDTVRVDLHTHTIFSDGGQAPEALALSLVHAGVRFAALTDHDTLEGLTRFSAALARSGIPCLPGVELTTWFGGLQVHLVAYAFDPDDRALAATLISMRQARNQEVHSIAESLRKAGSRRAAGTGPADADATSSAPDGTLGTTDAIALVHRAGGRAFLAHPLVYETETGQLEDLVVDLAAAGLDGIEAVYPQFTTAEQAELRRLARAHDLLVCAGSDFHGGTGLGSPQPGVDMPREEWLALRAALFTGPVFAQGLDRPASVDPVATRSVPSAAATPRPPADRSAGRRSFRWRSFGVRVVLPTLAAMALFLVALWGVLLPSFEQTLVERKREMIRELATSAWSILAAFQRDEQEGLLTRQEAQAAAARLVSQLRYGPESKDYFWIQDTQPRMIMHPYRPDLDGQELGGFTDPRGVAIFAQFADTVERDGQGYVDYVWQWQDDPARLEPKESYVKGFTPCGWIVGTGLYVDDVRAEIGRIEQGFIGAALAVSGGIALLLLFALQQSLRIERRRQEVVEGLRGSTARYQALVEATTEGTMLVLDGRCRYANPTLLSMLGYTGRQLEFLELLDVLPRQAANAPVWGALDAGDTTSPALGEPRQGCLSHRDGSVVECILALEPITFGDQPGYILLARDVTRTPAAGQVDDPGDAAGRRALIESLQTSLLFLHEPVAGPSHPAVVVSLETSIAEVARRVTEHEATAAMVALESGAIVGIVTDRDLRARAMAEHHDPAEPVHAVMSAPVVRIAGSAPVYEALMRMEEHGVHHLAVEDPGGRIVGVVDAGELIGFSRYGPIVLQRQVASAASPDAVARACERAVPLAGGLIDGNARPRPVVSLLTSVLDAATVRLIELATDELGPAPSAFAFFAMGSQGRSEVTLATDQDHAIVYEAVEGQEPAMTADWFLRLGSRVSEGLAAAGYPFCRGRVMAGEPGWCRSLPDWLAVGDGWVRRGEPQDVADLSVFLDARAIHGEARLLHELRHRIHAALAQAPAVQYQLMQSALAFRPPMRLPGNIYVGGAADLAGRIDLKDALMPIVAFARVQAARNGITQTRTPERIDALAQRAILPRASRDEIVDVVDLLLQLRLETQMAAIRTGGPPTSSVELASLGHVRRESLRQAFALIAAIQRQASHEFPVGG